MPYKWPDLLLVSAQYGSQIVGKVSPWIQPDAADEALRMDSQAALRQELEWATHLSLQACILHLPPSPSSADFAHVVNQVMHGLSGMAMWLRIPLMSGKSADLPSTAVEEDDSWERWNQVRCLTWHNAKLGVVLDVPAVLPPKEEIVRWYGEPVKALMLPTSVFLNNKRGYPTLTKAHQEMLLTFFAHGVQSAASEAAAAAVHPLRVYCEYLSYLFRKPPMPDGQEQLEVGYRDYLQAPLQPLQDNLEMQTYETFEKDLMKYTQYEAAVLEALLDRVPEEEAATRDIVLMVVGAGRGPLVRASLSAAERAKRKLRIYAVEKNPNAIISLQNLIATEGWGDRVTLVPADMRRWQAPELADIVVSELLGSFGDNELSPECLDGAQACLKPDGISIPASYTSYLQPITTAKLWNDVKVYNDLEHFETPYVVKLHRFTALADTQPVFTFRHPNREAAIDNARAACLRFDRTGRLAAVCHGFAGYFDACLYGSVHLSIHPPTHTPDMYSWFPIYFPLKEPVSLPADVPIEAHLWRCGAHHKVWYEWALTSPTAITHIHNSNGRSYYVGL
ncbi:protein arginine N-methyltransferase 5 [Coccomyxa subellipsoidea C-169]|uniref:Protein arginine N-methyltransferase n=1 Tax=Coccomyxa subellipsoidea (strain C-169) TaxID=574566 RepID=I0Z3A5_COCSC|nr:protein arginine N-methyltransferase 5 [Coccomyxa subellipsoidea C-169]EIE25124.1 protein arginine N-methyltransferase 5 [Coccomyxa subellipsoidea C-169]|eukprot:XP_005649668.1 protein arginine N-methyltransferase 5 [Coccomyxa subellipsoidea C-169]